MASLPSAWRARRAVQRLLPLLAAAFALAACASAADALPDLVPALTLAATAADGEPTVVNVTVNNAGDAPSGLFTVELTLDGSPSSPPLSFPDLAAGASASIEVDRSFACGRHNLTARADPGGAVAESAEANNNATQPIAVTPAARFTWALGGELGSHNVTLDASTSSGCSARTFGWEVETVSRLSNETVTFDAPAGNLTVHLYVASAADPGLVGTSTQIVIVPNAAPVITSALLPEARVNTGRTIDLIVLATDNDGYVAAYLADFGDGNYTANLGAISEYKYRRPGNYTIHILVTDNFGATDEASMSIEVLNRAPTAAVALKYVYADTGQSVKFDATSSADPEDGALTYLWEFGDGANGTGKVTNHTYSSPGDFEARLTVSDEFGASSNVTIEVNILGAPGGSSGALSLVAGIGVALLLLYYIMRVRGVRGAGDAGSGEKGGTKKGGEPKEPSSLPPGPPSPAPPSAPPAAHAEVPPTSPEPEPVIPWLVETKTPEPDAGEGSSSTPPSP